jgi:hypothetical protein
MMIFIALLDEQGGSLNTGGVPTGTAPARTRTRMRGRMRQMYEENIRKRGRGVSNYETMLKLNNGMDGCEGRKIFNLFTDVLCQRLRGWTKRVRR